MTTVQDMGTLLVLQCCLFNNSLNTIPTLFEKLVRFQAASVYYLFTSTDHEAFLTVDVRAAQLKRVTMLPDFYQAIIFACHEGVGFVLNKV